MTAETRHLLGIFVETLRDRYDMPVFVTEPKHVKLLKDIAALITRAGFPPDAVLAAVCNGWSAFYSYVRGRASMKPPEVPTLPFLRAHVNEMLNYFTLEQREQVKQEAKDKAAGEWKAKQAEWNREREQREREQQEQWERDAPERELQRKVFEEQQAEQQAEQRRKAAEKWSAEFDAKPREPLPADWDAPLVLNFRMDTPDPDIAPDPDHPHHSHDESGPSQTLEVTDLEPMNIEPSLELSQRPLLRLASSTDRPGGLRPRLATLELIQFYQGRFSRLLAERTRRAGEAGAGQVAWRKILVELRLLPPDERGLVIEALAAGAGQKFVPGQDFGGDNNQAKLLDNL